MEEKKYICNKESFLLAKEEQKNIAKDLKEKKIKIKKYNKNYIDWILKKPNSLLSKELYDWSLAVPKIDFYICREKEKARAHNLVYGLIKGRKIQQIEQKTRTNLNVFAIAEIKRLSKKYNLDVNFILNEIDKIEVKNND